MLLFILYATEKIYKGAGHYVLLQGKGTENSRNSANGFCHSKSMACDTVIILNQ